VWDTVLVAKALVDSGARANDPRLGRAGEWLIERQILGVRGDWAKKRPFALPGGFMYLNRGLIEAAKTEGQLAGVMAHEMSHVALRHGTNQASRLVGQTGWESWRPDGKGRRLPERVIGTVEASAQRPVPEVQPHR
jgi:hypothetical protein